MKIEIYTDSMQVEWDRFCIEGCAANFQHTRKFLSYHAGRFRDISLVLLDEKGKVLAVFPAAVDNSDPRRVISHPGATYGGIVYQGRKSIEQVWEMFQHISEWYSNNNYVELIYKTTPAHCQNHVSVIDQYILWRLNSTLFRRDLWNVLLLDGSRSLSKGRKWSLNKAHKNGVVIRKANDMHDFEIFHNMLASNLLDRHETSPVHSLQEMWDLSHRFPESMTLWLAADADDQVCAGTWLFDLSRSTVHTQYIASNEHGRNLFAVDKLLEHLITQAEESGKAFFSFGASTENNGGVVNEGLFAFKSGFGIGSSTHDFYSVSLKKIQMEIL